MGGRLYTNDLTTHQCKGMGGRLYTNDLTTHQYKGMGGRLYKDVLQSCNCHYCRVLHIY
jgi:hypothetical protein